MTSILKETDRKAARILLEGYRAQTPEQRYHAMWDMIHFVRGMQWAETRQRYPDAPDREIDLRVASRWIEPELMRKAFGWDPEVEGY